jgi:hypothetical protein
LPWHSSLPPIAMRSAKASPALTAAIPAG